jgi:hypothetical protein
VRRTTTAMSTLSDAFLRLQLRGVRETGTARVMLVEGDDPGEIARRIRALAYEQGLEIAVEFDADSFSLAELPVRRSAFG